MPLKSALAPPDLGSFETEQSLVCDLKYLLLCSDTPSFRFSHPDAVGAQASPPAPSANLRVYLTFDITTIHENQLECLNEFLQLALIIKKLNVVSAPSTTPTTTETPKSSVHAAFHANIYNSVVDFQTFLNALYIKESLSTFISLKYHLNDWFFRFRHIYYLYLKSNLLPPNQFLSLLHDFTLSGDGLTRALSLEYFSSTLLPYLDLLSGWLFLGTLNNDDAKRESFFIFQPETNTNTDFQFDKSLVPSFLNGTSAFQIFQIGKSIRFLKTYLNDLTWCETFFKENSHLKNQLNENIITNLYTVVICHLNDLLLLDFQTEISNLKKFLLFEQGDLIDAIIEKGYTLLNENSINLSSNQLITLLQDSIDSSSVHSNIDPKIYNRIDARLLNLNLSSCLGWNVFTLDFKLLPHIDYLVKSNYKEYLRVFNFLFKLKVLDFQLSKNWKESNNKQLNSALRNNTKFKFKIKSYQKKFNLMRHQFISFISSIFLFVQNDILSLNYNNLAQRLSNKDTLFHLKNNKLMPFSLNSTHGGNFNLDDLKEMHSQYILSISRSELFSNNSNKLPLNQILYQLVLIIEKFVNLSTEFQISLKDLNHLENLSLNHINQSNLQQYDKLVIDKINGIYNTLSVEIVVQFENNMSIFLNSLSSSKNQSLNALSELLEA